MRDQPRNVLAAIHARRFEQEDVLEAAIQERTTQSQVFCAIGQRADFLDGERQTRQKLTIEWLCGFAEHHEVGRLLLHAAAHHLEQRLRQLVGGASVVQDNGDAVPLVAA